MIRRTRAELEAFFDKHYGGHRSVEELEQSAKERGLNIVLYIAKVAYLFPHEVITLEAKTKEVLTATIEQADNGRGYVARYFAISSDRQGQRIAQVDLLGHRS